MAFRDVSKKSKKPARRDKNKLPASAPAGESRAAEAVTVAWMLSVLATAAADVGALLLWLLGRFWPVPAGREQAWIFLPLLLAFMAAITGLVCLLLIPVVYRVRRDPPPLAITIFAAVASAIPWGVIVALVLSA